MAWYHCLNCYRPFQATLDSASCVHHAVKCPNCKTDFGTGIYMKEPPPKVCSYCGVQIDKDSYRCKYCGAKI